MTKQTSTFRLLPENRWLSLVLLLVGVITLYSTAPGVISGEGRAILPVVAMVLAVIVLLVGIAGLVVNLRRGR